MTSVRISMGDDPSCNGRQLSRQGSLKLGNDSPRRVCVWIAAFGAVLLLTVPPQLHDPFCAASGFIYSGLTYREVFWRPDPDGVAVSILYYLFSPCVAAMSVAIIIDHRGRYQPRWRLHRFTWYYAVVTAFRDFVFLLYSIWIRWYGSCQGHDETDWIFDALAILGGVLTVASIVILLYTQMFKLASMDGMSVRCETVLLVVAFLLCLLLWLLRTRLAGFGFPSLLFVSLVLLLPVQVFMIKVSRRYFLIAHDVRLEAAHTIGDEKDAYQASAILAKWSSWSVLFSFVTCDLTLLAFLVYLLGVNSSLPFQLARCLDSTANSVCSLVMSGILGPRVDMCSEIESVTRLVAAARERAIQQKLLSVLSSSTGAAVTIAALLSEKDPLSVIAEARGRFRCISWDTLRNMPEIICASGTNGQATASIAHLHALSEACDLGCCDAFLSHSWHDDASLKWAALWTWCEDFRTAHGRAPLLWLDKTCIDQNDIVADLACLPVFLAGCNTLLIISGTTFTSRLWCVMELFVFMTMRDVEDHAQSVTLIYAALDLEQERAVRRSWIDFTSADCKCFDPGDKQKILNAISQSHGGMKQFDNHVKEMARTAELESPHSCYIEL